MSRVISEAWDFGDPAASEGRFRELARRASNVDRAHFETQVARALALQARYADALAVLDALEPQLDSYPEEVRIRWLLERGRCLRSSGSVEPARPLFVDAWDRARASRLDPLAIDAAHMVALTLVAGEALEWNQRALDVANDSTDPLARRWRTALYNNIGWTYHDAGDYGRALTSFERALDAARALDDPQVTRIAEWSVGRALRSMGRHSEALAIQRRLEREMPDPDGYVFEELAENLLALGQGDEAQPYFAKAYSVLSHDRDLAASEPARIERLRRLGGATTGGERG